LRRVALLPRRSQHCFHTPAKCFHDQVAPAWPPSFRAPWPAAAAAVRGNGRIVPFSTAVARTVRARQACSWRESAASVSARRRTK
jgi:hypothetical protein